MNPTFLVAEADTHVRAMVRDVILGMGFRVRTAASLAEAVAALAVGEPEVVLSGDNLGDGTAEQLCAEMDRLGYDVPKVLVVEPDREGRDASAGLGASVSWLEKPLDRERLEATVRQSLVIKKRIRQERLRARELTSARSFLHALLNTGDEAHFLLDADGAVLDISEGGAGLLNLARADVEGRPYLDLLPRKSAAVLGEVIERARDSLEPQRTEETRDGSVFITTVRPVLDKAGLAGFVLATCDISALRRSEAGFAESEKRYRSVFEASRDAILLLDRASGAVIECNMAASRLYGYERDEMRRLTLKDISAEVKRSMEGLQAGVARVPLRYHRRKDGASFPVEVSMSHFVHNGRGVATAYIRDISQRKAVEEALREGARLYRAVVEDQTELICRYTPEGVLTFTNGAFAKFFGVDEDQVVGTRFVPRMARDERRDLKSWLKEVGPNRPVFDREQRVQRFDGEPRWVLWTNRAVFNHKGEIQEIQAVGRDITDKKETEAALEQAQAEREQYRLNLEATFRSIPDAIISVNSELEVIATNSAAGTMFGLDRERMLHTPIEEWITAGNRPCLSALEQVLKTNKPVRGYETELEVPEHGARTVELNCTPLIDQNKRHTGAVLVVRDVSRIADLEKRLHERHGFRGIIGRSAGMQDMYRLLEQLSSLDSIVLVLGESGTGKELVADALHYGGSRAGAPFIKVNCSALSESLLESELFGHVRGAFTGAVRDKIGRIQAAQGGTLFLDEIGDISPLIQLKLLRFLEQKEYERVGDSKTLSADVRIIAATNVDLREAVRQGVFREDLYYRLNVMPVTLPPLRERQADIPLLVDHFLDIFSEQFNKTFAGLSEEVMDLFMRYPWPGNIRELRHTLEHACILSKGGELLLRHMRQDLVEQMRTYRFVPATPGAASQAETLAQEPAPTQMAVPASPGPAAYVAEYAQAPGRRPGREDILEALERSGGNKAKAARMLGIHRATLYRKLKG